MVSPELMRRYPFFGNLSKDQLNKLAQAGHELSVETGHYFFREGDELVDFYVVLEGEVGINVDLTDDRVEQPLSGQLTGEIFTREIVTSKVGPGEMFGWSALVPPHTATSSCKALSPCRVVGFDCKQLHQMFEEDCRFGYVMLMKATKIIRARLRSTRIESLSEIVPGAV
jgi:CRP-like cAMP-binding protein